MSSEFIGVIANIALTLSLIVAIVFGIAQIKSAKRDRRERLTIDALVNFHSKEFSELILFTTTSKFPTSHEGWLSMEKEDHLQFIQVSQQMESIGILLADGVIETELVDKTLGSFITTTWQKFKRLVLDMREKLGDPYLSEYFQWMAEQMEKRMKDNPRKPFFES